MISARHVAPDSKTPVHPVATVPRLALSMREVAESLGVSERTVAQWVSAGVAPPSFRQGRLRLFPVAAVEAWLLDRTREAGEQDGHAAGEGTA